mgnify:CR=1 FL=1
MVWMDTSPFLSPGSNSSSGWDTVVDSNDYELLPVQEEIGYDYDDKGNLRDGRSFYLRVEDSWVGEGKFWWWFNIFTFVAHVATCAWILVLLFRTNENCSGDVNKMHYAEVYSQNLMQGQPVGSRSSGNITMGGDTAASAWPVLVDDYRDVSTSVSGSLNVARCLERTFASGFNVGGTYLEQLTLLMQGPQFWACAATGVVETVEITYNQWYTTVLGSSNSILYLMLVFEWLSASFALYTSTLMPHGRKMLPSSRRSSGTSRCSARLFPLPTRRGGRFPRTTL